MKKNLFGRKRRNKHRSASNLYIINGNTTDNDHDFLLFRRKNNKKERANVDIKFGAIDLCAKNCFLVAFMVMLVEFHTNGDKINADSSILFN